MLKETGIAILFRQLLCGWNFFVKIMSQQTCVWCDTIFVKKFQMNYTCATFGTREYISEQSISDKKDRRLR